MWLVVACFIVAVAGAGITVYLVQPRPDADVARHVENVREAQLALDETIASYEAGQVGVDQVGTAARTLRAQTDAAWGYVNAMNRARPADEQLPQATVDAVLMALTLQQNYADQLGVLVDHSGFIDHEGFAGHISELAGKAQAAWDAAAEAMPGLKAVEVKGGSQGELKPAGVVSPTAP